MEWLPLKPLDLPGANAATINRRIATHMEFRRQIDADDPAVTRQKIFIGRLPTSCDTKEKAIREALNRELFIRRDIIILLQSKGVDSSAAIAAMEEVRQQLKTLE